MKLLVAVLFAMIAVAASQSYTSKFDNVDVDQILTSDRLFNNYFKCLVGKGRCTPEGSELKKTLPDALKTACEKCTPRQRDGTDRVLRFLIEKKNDQWNELQKIYDSEGVYIQRYRQEALERGIQI